MTFFRRQTRSEGFAHGAAAGLVALGLILAPSAEAQNNPQGKPAHARPHAKSASGKAAHTKGKPSPAKSDAAAAPAAEPPASEPPPPPYEPQILRLAEILGALTYLDELCGSNNSAEWRAQMQALIDAEAKTEFRKERLAGGFNRGFRGYERSYRVCTPNAQSIINRFLSEGEKLSHDVISRFSAS